MTSEALLHLEDVTGDLVLLLEVVQELRGSGGSATYETVRQATDGDLHLHLLSYVRFLENGSYLTYDRITDEMEVTAEGDQARQAPHQLQEAARQAFEEQIDAGEDDGLGDMLSDVFDDMDDAFGSMDGGVTINPENSTGGAPTPQEGVSFRDTEGAGPSSYDVLPSDAPSNPKESPAATSPPPAQEVSMSGQHDSTPSNNRWAGTATGESFAPAVSSAGAYERVEELGSGGLGTVYRGRQTSLNREVAIKEIREIFNVFAGIDREAVLDRFRGIVEAQASLLHPNIVQVVDVNVNGQYPFSVTQFAPNGNLRTYLEHGDRPSLRVSLKYFLQIVHALNVAHDQGIIHGSLKPENVVRDHAGNALLTDFGISKIVKREGGNQNQVYVGVGSVAYMSPEQFQDPNLATIQTDIYSLGIMFYEMLTGKVPGRRSPMPSSFFPDIPRALDDIFDRMTMDREDDRYSSVDEILADLYGSEEVMLLLDKRSGVLFFRDPIVYGEFGLGDGVEMPEIDEAVIADPGPSPDDYAPAASAEGSSELSEASEVDEASEVGEEDDDKGPSSTESSDVLNKLDQYGEMFDD